MERWHIGGHPGSPLRLNGEAFAAANLDAASRRTQVFVFCCLEQPGCPIRDNAAASATESFLTFVKSLSHSFGLPARAQLSRVHPVSPRFGEQLARLTNIYGSEVRPWSSRLGSPGDRRKYASQADSSFVARSWPPCFVARQVANTSDESKGGNP
jgi:hypothetical protein